MVGLYQSPIGVCVIPASDVVLHVRSWGALPIS